MAHMIETMAYTGEVPWHGLGVKVSPNLLPKEMLDEAGLNWKVEKERIKTESGIYIPNRFALTRSSDNKPLSICSDKYIPIQNADAFEFFQKFVKAGKMTMETAGSLEDGKRIWGLARMKSGDFELANQDKVEGYILLAQPHIPGKAMTIMFTPIRVVCHNTITMALNRADQNLNGVFRMTHHKEFDQDMKILAENVLGLSSEKMKAFKETAQYLSGRKATAPMVSKYFVDLFQSKDKKTIDEKIIYPLEDEFSPTMRKLLDVYDRQPGAEMSPHTWWTAFNAVTYYTDHVLGRSNDTRLKASWFGVWAKKKTQALEFAIDYAKHSRAA